MRSLERFLEMLDLLGQVLQAASVRSAIGALAACRFRMTMVVYDGTLGHVCR
jgi:hypothetical protein